MIRRLVVVMLLAACGSSPAPRPDNPGPRQTFTRRELPPEVQPLVPRHGVFLAGAGAKSATFRVIVDTDLKAIKSGSAPAGTPLHSTLADERGRELTPRNEQHLMRLCADAWNERAPAQDPSPTAVSYEEMLVIADGEELFILHAKGPIERPAARKAIEALRAAAAL